MNVDKNTNTNEDVSAEEMLEMLKSGGIIDTVTPIDKLYRLKLAAKQKQDNTVNALKALNDSLNSFLPKEWLTEEDGKMFGKFANKIIDNLLMEQGKIINCKNNEEDINFLKNY